MNAQQLQKSARARILDEAMEITHKDRNATYGSPEDNFQQIANLWNAYLRAVRTNTNNTTYGGHLDIKPADVAIMNLLIKVARLAKSPSHHDSAVDIAGYAACLGEIQQKLRAAQDSLSLKDNPIPPPGSWVQCGEQQLQNQGCNQLAKRQGTGQVPGTEKF